MESKCGDVDCPMCSQVREIFFPDIDPVYAAYLLGEQKDCLRRRQKNSASGTSSRSSPTLDDTFVTHRVRIEAKPVRSAQVNNKRISTSFLRSS